MKKRFMLFLAGILCIGILAAQVPQKFNYQGLARSSSGSPLVNKTINLRISILDGSASGPVVYMETQFVITNQFGLFSTAIGSGTVLSGNLSTVAWGSGDKYLRIEMDPNGGTAWTAIGTNQLLSVPYAMYAMSPAGPQGPPGPQGPQGPPGAGSLSGTVNKVVKFTGTSVGGDSQISDDGTNVMVGFTTTPSIGSYKLATNGNLNIVNGQLGLYSASNQYLGFLYSPSAGSMQLGLPLGATGNLSFFDGTTQAMTIYNGGKIAVGSNAPNVSKLEIQGTSIYGAALGLRNMTSTTGNEWSVASLDNGDLCVIKVSGSTFTPVTINSLGMMGIGTTTPLNGMLHLNSTAQYPYEGIHFTHPASGTDNFDGFLVGPYTSNSNDLIVWNMEAGKLQFATSNIERMQIEPGGKVGIGTSTMDGQLTVQNSGSGLVSPTAHLKNTGSAGVGLFVENNSTDATAVFTNAIGTSATATLAKYFDGGASDIIRLDNYDGAHLGRIRVFGGNTGLNGGGAIFGSDTYGLVLSDIAPSTGAVTSVANADKDGSGNLIFEPWVNNLVTCGSSTYRWSAVWAVNGTIQTSDERDKENIKPLEYGIKTVMDMKPVSFRWKNDQSRLGTGTNLGFVAQDLEKVVPDAVIHSFVSAEEIGRAQDAGRGEVQPDSYGVKYAELIPVLVKAIQEQQSQIEQLKTEIQNLKNSKPKE